MGQSQTIKFGHNKKVVRFTRISVRIENGDYFFRHNICVLPRVAIRLILTTIQNHWRKYFSYYEPDRLHFGLLNHNKVNQKGPEHIIQTCTQRGDCVGNRRRQPTFTPARKRWASEAGQQQATLFVAALSQQRQMLSHCGVRVRGGGRSLGGRWDTRKVVTEK